MNDPAPELLRAFLGEHDVACPGCGYNLRNLQGSRCPECGDELHLQVGLVEPRQAAGIAGLIGLAAGAGLSGLLLGYVLIRLTLSGDQFSDMGRFLLINCGGLAIESVAILLWLRNWRRIRRLNTPARRALVIACWGLTLLNLFVFSVLIK